MGRLTDDRPKGLVELHGLSLIDWQIRAMRSSGIKEIGIVTGYRADLLASHGDRHFHNENWATTNMVASLQCASEWLETDDCVISYSDIVYHRSAIDLLAHTTADLAITFDPNWLRLWSMRFEEPLSDAETFKVSDDGTLLEIGGRPTSTDEVQGQYMGLVRVSPRGWGLLLDVLHTVEADRRPTIHLTGLLDQTTRVGALKVACLPYLGTWSEVDSASDLAITNSMFDGLLHET